MYDIAVLLTHWRHLKTLLIGLGRAGWRYSDRPSADIISHTPAILLHPDFDLICGIDLDKTLRTNWSAETGKPSFNNMEDSKLIIEPELVVIATSTPSLLKTLLDALQKYPRSKILVEKPIVIDREGLNTLKYISDDDKCRILVNLPRVFQNESFAIRDSIKIRTANDTNKILISGYYSNGYLNTGIHVIHFLDFLFGATFYSTTKVRNQYPVMDMGRNINFPYTPESRLLGNLCYRSDTGESNFSFSIKLNDELTLEYLNGGQQFSFFGQDGISLLSNQNTSSRSTYQYEVYNSIAKYAWNELIGLAGASKVIRILEQMLSN